VVKGMERMSVGEKRQDKMRMRKMKMGQQGKANIWDYNLKAEDRKREEERPNEKIKREKIQHAREGEIHREITSRLTNTDRQRRNRFYRGIPKK